MAPKRTLRRNQAAIIDGYSRGRMGISAVPGSGKTFTLSQLAGKIVASGVLDDTQEVLIVTMSNSAVDNFSHQIAEYLNERGLLPGFGYCVRTLHGLANDIVRERPGLVGLTDNFQIIDDREADSLFDEVFAKWAVNNPDFIEQLVSADAGDWYQKRARGEEGIPKLLKRAFKNFVSRAKNLNCSPEAVRRALDLAPSGQYPLAEAAWSVYADYQRKMTYRGSVDFSDLMRLAYTALSADPDFARRLQNRWPYIFEDEAQDSNNIQEQILRLLTGGRGNWVRVGDPNQAIFETFTNASPEFLMNFMQEADVDARELPVSGRSAVGIIDLANYLIDWTTKFHDIPEVRDALTIPKISPTGPDDPKPNPCNDDCKVFFNQELLTQEQEVKAVVDNIEKSLHAMQDRTMAVLVPSNTIGFAVVDELRKREIPFVDSLLRSSMSTRETAGTLWYLFNYLSDMHSPQKLVQAFHVWHRDDRGDEDRMARVNEISKLLKKCPRVENFLYPTEEADWLESQGLKDSFPEYYDDLVLFREKIRNWLKASFMPPDQLLLIIAQDVFKEASEFAVAYKIASVLRQVLIANPDWRMAEACAELHTIANNERRFLGFSDDDTNFVPDRYKGKVAVATMHKAKGLEWDRVYLMALNSYEFPSGSPQDPYGGEKIFVRDGLNLEAETIAQLISLTTPNKEYIEGDASMNARYEQAKERLRLLYVAITRAKTHLWLSWNTGPAEWKKKNQAALAFNVLSQFDGYRAA